MESQKTFLVLDANALLHRAWHAIPPLTTRDGRVVNAAYGFANVVEKMLAVYSPTYMAAAWDLPGATFRHDAYEPYKAQREKKADELYEQIPIIQEILAAYGIPSLSAPGFEADDVIGTIATNNAQEENVQTLIVTGDRDALQLVNETTKVIFFVKGLSEVKTYDVQAVKEKYGLLPAQLIDLKALMGDASDNLPGVPGIGEKGAKELVEKFGSIENMLSACREGVMEEKYAKKFLGKEEDARKMRMLGEIVTKVPLENFSYEACATGRKDDVRLRALFEDLEFSALAKKYGSVSSITERKTKKEEKQKQQEEVAGRKVATPEGIMGDWVALWYERKERDMFGGTLAKIILTDGKRIWIAEHPEKEVLDALGSVLARVKYLVTYQVKEFMHAAQAMGKNIAEDLKKSEIYDAEIIAYMLNSGAREFPLENIIADTLEQKPSSPEELALLMPALGNALKQKLQETGMEKLYLTAEMPLMRVLFLMEHEGIAVNHDMLTKLADAFGTRIDALTKQIHELAGKTFNVNSPAQLADVLFITLGLPTKGIKKTKTGFSTAAPELEKLWETHAIIPLIEEYREVAKLKSTYADTLPDLIAQDGRIHTRFNQTIAATGRLSSSNPNVQNIPIRTELGKQIRYAFVAKQEYVLMSADYSQIELRLAAELARDESFLRAFQEKADIHKRTAAEVWNIKEEEVTKEQRAAAKAINFSILYGVGPRALAKATGMHFEEAREFIARYFAVHPGIQAYIDAMKLQARTQGYVQTLFGRRRYLPDITSGVPQLIAAAERMAMNMPIQGTQADIIKMAMIAIADALEQEKLRAKLVLQVHDEVILEVHQDDVVRVEEIVREKMGSVTTLRVPLVVDVATGASWGDIA